MIIREPTNLKTLILLPKTQRCANKSKKRYILNVQMEKKDEY